MAQDWRPYCSACGLRLPSGPGQYDKACPGCGEAWDGSELPPMLVFPPEAEERLAAQIAAVDFRQKG